MTTDDMNPEEILEQAKSAARHAAHMLTLRRPNSKVCDWYSRIAFRILFTILTTKWVVVAI